MKRTVVLGLLLVGIAAPCAAAATATLKGVVTAASGPVADAVVLLEGPSHPAPARAPHVVMDQRGEQFVPHVLAVPVGTTVDFPNSDAVLHNVSSASQAKRFDLGMYGQGETRSVTFDTPGVIAIRCNVHPRMSAFVVVHTNPFTAVTDKHGGYTIAGAPGGSYTVRVWHQDLGERTVPVTMREGQVQPLDVRLEPRP